MLNAQKCSIFKVLQRVKTSLDTSVNVVPGSLYCPESVSICTFARIVFDYFPNGSNEKRLAEKVKLNHDEDLSYTSARHILQSKG